MPPPEKWHGLTDLEQRYRRRYVDLFTNPESLQTFLGRSKIIASFRKTMAEKGFVEVETPTMQAIAGGAAARPFVTHHNTLDIDLFLRIAPELYLKRLLVGGMERVFEIGRVYRNEGISPKHNPEFTMLEAYQAYGDYHAMMDLTEALICGSIEALGGGYQRPWGEATIDFTPPWPRRTYAELLAEHAGVDPADFASIKARAEAAGNRHGGQGPRRGHERALRGGRRRPPDRSDLRDRLSGGHLPADQAKSRRTRRSPSGSSFISRASSWPTPTPSSMIRSCRSSSSAASSRACPRRSRWPRWTTTSSGPSSTPCPRPAGWASASTALCMILMNRPSIRDVILFPLMRPRSPGREDPADPVGDHFPVDRAGPRRESPTNPGKESRRRVQVPALLAISCRLATSRWRA